MLARWLGFNGAAGFTPLKAPPTSDRVEEIMRVSMEQRVLPR